MTLFDDMKTQINLTAGQLSSLRELVNTKQDALFDKLQAHEAGADQGAHRPVGERGRALRESLRYWDEIDRAIRDAHGIAFDAQHAAQANR